MKEALREVPQVPCGWASAIPEWPLSQPVQHTVHRICALTDKPGGGRGCVWGPTLDPRPAPWSVFYLGCPHPWPQGTHHGMLPTGPELADQVLHVLQPAGTPGEQPHGEVGHLHSRS